MPDAIMLSPDTYDRLKRLLDDWDSGFEKTIKLGAGLKIEERGTDYLKIGIDKAAPPNVFPSGTITVTNGIINVGDVTTISLNQYLFKLSSSGTGIANITLNTTNCN